MTGHHPVTKGRTSPRDRGGMEYWGGSRSPTKSDSLSEGTRPIQGNARLNIGKDNFPFDSSSSSQDSDSNNSTRSQSEYNSESDDDDDDSNGSRGRGGSLDGDGARHSMDDSNQSFNEDWDT